MPVSRASSFGFTLLELSVVLVIIGLLLGAVVGGQAMIRSAELQSIVSDYTRYKDAVVTFEKQYKSIPGDMIDAEDFWGRDALCGGVSTTGTCNGDDNGILTIDANSDGGIEDYQFWRQLALAGRIIGTYSGASGAGSEHSSVPGTNVPQGRITGSGWDAGGEYIASGTVYTPTPGTFDPGNHFIIGREVAGEQARGPLLTPEEAWQLDTKLDDGRPGQGTIISSHPVGACATGASTADFAADYNLNEKSEQCALFFIQQF